MTIGRAASIAISTAGSKARKGLEDAKKEPHRLRGCVADGSCGVRLIASESRRGPSIQARAAWAMTPLNLIKMYRAVFLITEKPSAKTSKNRVLAGVREAVLAG